MAKSGFCGKCVGLCCRYFALPIDTPETKSDYEDIRWYLTHKNVAVFVEEGDWYLNINSKCRHLSEKDHSCKIYAKRPKICKKYKIADCDLSGSEYDYESAFHQRPADGRVCQSQV